MNIILIGMPGCGKSTVGVLLAKALQCTFVDCDLIIQKRCGMSLQEIIDRRGLSEFLAEEEDTAGKTAAFCFRNDTYSVSVTKAGGYPLSLISDITVTETSLTQADAVEKASLFLGQIGFFDMVSTYAATDDGICTVNFAYKTGSFICYPDLIKVQVALSDGKITGFDASDYIMNHKKRDIPAFTFTPEDAAEGIVSSLDIQEISAAVIPTESGTEYFTYELLCEGEDGQHILIYKDILTLEEVDILILLYSDNGTLTK